MNPTNRPTEWVTAYQDRVRLQMYALRLARNPEFLAAVEREGAVTGAGRPAAEVLAPYRR